MCNCKQPTNVVATVVPDPTPVPPETPEQFLNEMLKDWNGGPKPDDYDWYNNLDEIKPIEDGR
jgi:hypothetical protein